MAFALIPHVVSNQTIRALATHDTALQAGQMMLEHDISAIVVLDENGKLVGIVTERDLARRVVAAGLHGEDVPLKEVMTADPAHLSPGDSPFDALELMRDRRIRHVPLDEDGTVVGMVSLRDLRHAIAAMPRERGKGWLGGLFRLGNR